MPNAKIHLILSLIISILTLGSCVPQRQFEDMKAERDRYKQEKIKRTKSLDSLKQEHEELRESHERIRKQLAYLEEDTAMLAQKYRRTQTLNEDLNDLYKEVIAQNKKLLETSSSERAELNMELSKKQRKLKDKEAELNQLAKTLQQEQRQISQLRANLQEREQKVKELEILLRKKDSANNALKNRISEALLSYDDKELSVEVKEGKIYVSLAEQLLFSSGSTEIDNEGRKALNKLAEVLSQQTQTNIMVEGHTDSLPIQTKCIEDNWDLSILRATSIVRLMIKQGVSPERLVRSGRSKYMPVANNNTESGRRENRRTEIILAPKLDKIYSLIEEPKDY